MTDSCITTPSYKVISQFGSVLASTSIHRPTSKASAWIRAELFLAKRASRVRSAGNGSGRWAQLRFSTESKPRWINFVAQSILGVVKPLIIHRMAPTIFACVHVPSEYYMDSILMDRTKPVYTCLMDSHGQYPEKQVSGTSPSFFFFCLRHLICYEFSRGDKIWHNTGATQKNYIWADIF